LNEDEDSFAWGLRILVDGRSFIVEVRLVDLPQARAEGSKVVPAQMAGWRLTEHG
jgi:hypothetical protein